MTKIDTYFYAGQPGDEDEISITVSVPTLEDLWSSHIEGRCPICFNAINGDEIVCCECLADALTYHKGYCGCVEDSK